VSLPASTEGPVGIDAAAGTTGASVIRGGLWSVLSGLLPQVFTLVLSVAAARFLGPEAMGRQSFIAFVSISALTLFGSGLALGLMRAVAESLGRRAPADTQGIVAWARRVQFIGALAGAAVLAVPAVAGAEPVLAWALAALVTFLSILQTIPNAVLIGAQRFRETAVVGLVTGGVAVPTMIVVLALGGGISGMFGVEAAMVGANLVWTTLLSRRTLAEIAPIAPHADATLRQATMRYAAVSTLGAVLTLVVWRRSEFFFLARYSNDTEIALYSIAFAAATVLSSVTEKLAGVMSSAFATLHGARETERLGSGYSRTMRLLTMLGLPLTALSAGGGPAAIEVVYGSDYQGAGPVLLVLLTAIPLIPLWSVSASLLVAMGDARSPLTTGFVAAVVSVTMALVLIPPYDAVGAAVANVSGQIVSAVMMSRYALRYVGRGGVRWDAGALLRATVASVAAGALTYALCTGVGGALGLAAGVAAGVPALFLLLVLLRPLSAEDSEWLQDHVGHHAGGRVGRVARAWGRHG
jgi:O-antigen/teichoic acid export membrane protein